MEIIDINDVYSDDRGRITTLFNDGLWKEVNYIETKSDVIRGGHFHKEMTEMVYIIQGKVEITVESINDKKKYQIELNKGGSIYIHPYEIHVFKTLEDSIWLNFLSKPFNKDNPDLYTI